MNSIVHLVRKYSQIRVLTVVIIIAICSIMTACHAKPRQHKFVPYKGRVVSYQTDKTAYGGVYYQNINLDNKKVVTANGFTASVNGYKTNLIDYIAIGDSVECDSTDDVLYVYRAEAETYRFTYSPSDFK
ncbi:MAG: hypothetical protein J6Y72_10935 [Bacteroidales bacterium]|nr:hypothetical protein [Bacteroidales bacterium]